MSPINCYLFISFENQKIDKMKKSYEVIGMTCNHCKMNIEKFINAIDGVIKVEAFPNENKVIVEGDVSESEVRSKIELLGYQFIGIKEN